MVAGLKHAFLRGEYITTHQGIAFSEAGELLDGQHRLTAISELPEGSAFPMNVTRGIQKNAYTVIDIGSKRTAADALRLADRRLVEVARTIATICQHQIKATVTPQMLMPIIEEIDQAHTELISFCPTVKKAWSTSPVRLAAVTSMLTGQKKDYVKKTYNGLVTSDFNALPPVGNTLARAYISGSVRSSDMRDMLARCLFVFNEKNRAKTRIYIASTDDATSLIRTTFGHLITSSLENVEMQMQTEMAFAKSADRRASRVKPSSVSESRLSP